MKNIFLICARAGSKGLKNKNLRKINNLPLIGWSIKIAKKFNKFGKIVVNSDSDKILKYASLVGADILIKRPSYLAKDNSKEIDVWKHTLNKIYNDYKFVPKTIVSIPTTSPCRSEIDIKNCIKMFEKKKYDAVISVTPSHRNPYFNIVEIDKQNYARVCLSKKKFHNRQDAPKTYDITTVCYVADVDYIKKTKNILSGKIGCVVVPKERSIDIDTKLDLKIAKILKK